MSKDKVTTFKNGGSYKIKPATGKEPVFSSTNKLQSFLSQFKLIDGVVAKVRK